MIYNIDEMEIKDKNGIRKKALSIKIIENGYVEVIIEHSFDRSIWIEWYPLEEFRQRNPGINI